MDTADRASWLASATVLLLREGRAGMEVFMQRRPAEISAFAGALVFPGGKVAPGDGAEALLAHCRGAAQLDGQQRVSRVAAVREAFEESGVLLAAPAGSAEPISAERQTELLSYRQPLEAGLIDMLALCRAAGLELLLDRLVPFAHWITPPGAPRIFDTRFFLAPLPSGQQTHCDSGETLENCWLTPRAAITAAERGAFNILFPTRMTLLKLARYRHLDDALSRVASDPVPPVRVVVEPHPRGRIMTIPRAAGYGAERIFVPKDGGRFVFLD